MSRSKQSRAKLRSRKNMLARFAALREVNEIAYTNKPSGSLLRGAAWFIDLIDPLYWLVSRGCFRHQHYGSFGCLAAPRCAEEAQQVVISAYITGDFPGQDDANR